MATVTTLFMEMDITRRNVLAAATALCVFNVFVVYMCIAISRGSQRQLVNRGAHTSGGLPPLPLPLNHTHTLTDAHSCCTGAVDGIVKASWHL